MLGLGFVAAHRSGRRSDHRLLQVATVNLAAAVVAAARVTVDLDAFVVYWRVFTALFVVLAVIWSVWNSIAVEPRRAATPVFAGVGMAALVVLFGLQTAGVVRADAHGTARAAYDLFAQIPRELLHAGTVELRSVGNNVGGIDQALVNALDREVGVRVDPALAYRFGSSRAGDADPANDIWWIAEEGKYLSLVGALPEARVVASTTPLSRSQEAEMVGLQRMLARVLISAGHPDLVDVLDSRFVDEVLATTDVAVDRGALRRLARLNARVADRQACRCSVIALPPSVSPAVIGSSPPRP
jgi:hypothetical protein